MKPEIKTRAHLHILVSDFYDKIRSHVVLGPIFNSHIKDWNTHEEHITNFWESSLLHAQSYRDNPITKHIALDSKMNYGIKQEHFGFWLQIWFETVDLHFQGDIAALAKNRARNMGSYMFMEIYKARDKQI